MGSQCKSARVGEICWYFLIPLRSLTAAFCTICKSSISKATAVERTIVVQSRDYKGMDQNGESPNIKIGTQLGNPLEMEIGRVDH